jgi:hypothetical protein|tara:strand:+ start:401 stop:601 length:201 start_codon:yes stop_codon:yes gene_type:complete
MTDKELTKEQQYCKSQIEDLENKESQLSFQLDQVRASKTVFINLLAEHTKDVAEEVVDKSDKEKKK